MKYDLIVAGAGMAGLIAARTASQEGLKTLVIETKKNITEINRACSGVIRMSREGFMTAKKPTDKTVQPVEITLEMDPDKAQFHFFQLGFSVEYTGPILVYHNKVNLSPSGHEIWNYPDNNRFWAFQLDKEILTKDLLDAAVKAGTEVRTECSVLTAENVSGGVRVPVQGKARQEILEAGALVAADGVMSRIVETMGLNAKRRPLGESRVLMYILEGVKPDYNESTFVTIAVPSLNSYMLFALGLWPGDTFQLHTSTTPGTNLPEALDGLMKHPGYAPWFAGAKVVKKLGCARQLRTSLPTPAEGNVFFAGDAVSFVECSIKGALAAGFKAAKCASAQLQGKDGRKEFTDWWQSSFNFNSPQYIAAGRSVPRPTSVLTNAELDDLYRICKGKWGVLNDVITDNLELVKKEKPMVYEKLMAPPSPAHNRPEQQFRPAG
jgi:digeranylgeranylglycerophospholipid reductase